MKNSRITAIFIGGIITYYYQNYITIIAKKEIVADILYESKINGVYSFEGLAPVHQFDNPMAQREHVIAKWGCASDSLATYTKKIDSDFNFYSWLDDNDDMYFTFQVITEYGACTGWLKKVSKQYPDADFTIFYHSDSKHYGGYTVHKGIARRMYFDNYLDYLYCNTLGRITAPIEKVADDFNRWIDSILYKEDG